MLKLSITIVLTISLIFAEHAQSQTCDILNLNRCYFTSFTRMWNPSLFRVRRNFSDHIIPTSQFTDEKIESDKLSDFLQ